MANDTPTSNEPDNKHLSWFTPTLDHLSQPARDIFEHYSLIPPSRIIPHIIDVRNRAWQIHPHPCIGQFRFLDLSISLSPLYPSILTRLKAEDAVLLDVGCCFGQDIRKLVADGAPARNLYGCDLRSGFLDLGYELFRDRGRLESRFMTADVFDERGELRELDGRVDIVHAASFLHLFGWDDQVQVARRLVKLLRPRKGSLVLGRQVGNIKPGEFASRSGKGTMFRHNGESFKRMWDVVAGETGSRWDVVVTLEELRNREAREGESRERGWNDEGARWMRFEVERTN